VAGFYKKMDDSVAEIRSSNRTATWASIGLVATVLIGLIGVIVTFIMTQT
jgi:hypothetical protein